VDRARDRFPTAEFRRLDLHDVFDLEETFELVVVIATLGGVREWKRWLSDVHHLCNWLYIAQYIPDSPLGYIPSKAELFAVLEPRFQLKLDLSSGSDVRGVWSRRNVDRRS
jgi:hypothetical protein